MTDDRRKPQVGKQLLLRFAEGSDLRDRLDAIAKTNGRSTTAEVLIRLEASLKADEERVNMSFLSRVGAGGQRLANESELAARVQALENAVHELQRSLG